jgi:intergrase/recombinase
MGALAALANFLGEKEQWKLIVSKYNLKWSGRNDLGDLVGLLYSNRFDEMVTELKHALEKVPEDYANYFRFNVITGLRPSEAVKAVNMLRTNAEYCNQELGLLEHFRYPREFIRNTKKAFISVVDPETIEVARATRVLDYQGVRSEFRRRKLPFHMAYCRKIFATYMRKHVDTELVDMLQGRIPTTVFAKHYNRPNQLSDLEKVRANLPELRQLL